MIVGDFGFSGVACFGTTSKCNLCEIVNMAQRAAVMASAESTKA